MENARVIAWTGEPGSRWASALRRYVWPTVLLAATPPAVIVLWVCGRHLGGSLGAVPTRDGWSTLVERFPAPSWTAAGILAGFVLTEAALLRLLPARTHEGPVTPAGRRPRYRLNGLQAWLVTHVAFLGASYGLGWFSPGVLYERFGELLITMSLGCAALCLLLHLKGRIAPTSPDAGSSGSAVLDYFWGTELHLSVLGVDLKQLLNCRVGMMGWSLLVVSFTAHQHQHLGYVTTALAVSAVLQIVYILKFFAWEKGYLSTLDVMHDRLGYYLCWGVTTWLPGVYTLAAHHLATTPQHLPPERAAILLSIGLLAIGVNYDADRQRQRVRETNGTARIWGREPRLIRAAYVTADGRTHESLLLASGWWGVARHFHYVPELVAALAWTLPAGSGALLPYCYPAFLAILLIDRAGRDDRRCQAKYGPHWDRYRAAVRWRIVPYVY